MTLNGYAPITERVRVLQRPRLRVKLITVSEQLFDKLNCSFKYGGFKSLWIKIRVSCDYGISLIKMENPNGN